MRILAVRGKNLRSLEGGFEVAFDRGALGAAGLFAITGPTGAGKSTLLDAICLALFNSVPRITEGKSTIQIADGAGSIGAADPRTALRRHAADGFAEVDFVGLERRQYRARWSVRRARDRADGALQAVVMSLHSIGEDGETTQDLTPGGLKATLDVIEDRLGLTFDQFKRAALLAQGDFAAFLHAKADDRAVLLERLTGKEIYTTISKRAYERWKKEEAALTATGKQRDSFETMVPEVRATAEAQAGALAQQLTELRKLHESARTAVEWHRLAGLRADALDAARRAESETSAAWAGSEERRAELLAVKSAQRHRATLSRWDGRTADITQAERALESLRTDRAGAEQAQETATFALAEADARRAEAEGRQEAARPVLARALQLDTRIEEATGQATVAGDDAAKAEVALEVASIAATRLDVLVEDLGTRRQDAAAWLEAHATSKALAEEWPRWKHELERYTSAAGRSAEAEGRRVGLAEAHEGRLGQAKQAELLRAAAANAHDEAKTSITKAKAAAAELPPGPLRMTREALTATVKALQVLWRDARDAHRLAADREVQVERASRALADAEAAREQQRAAEERQRQLDAAIPEAERAAQHARDARDLVAQRAELRDGEPCPLCGATEHPWADGSPLATLVSDSEARVRTLRSEHQQAVKQGASAGSRSVACDKELADAERRAVEIAHELTGADAAWAEHRAAVDDPEVPTELLAEGARAALALAIVIRDEPRIPSTPASEHAPRPLLVEGVLDALERIGKVRAQEAKAVEALLADAEAFEVAVAKAQKALDNQRAAWDVATEAQQAAEREVVAAQRALEAAEGEMRQADKERGAAVEALSGAFVGREGWQQALRVNPAQFVGACAAEVARWQERVDAQATATVELTKAEPQRAKARSEAEAAGKQAAKALDLCNDRQQALQTLRVERAGVLGGRPRDQVEAELRSAVDEAKRAHGAAVVARDGAKEHLAGLTTRAGEMARQLEGLHAEAGEARGELDKALAALSVDLDTLRQRLSWDEQRIIDMEAELDVLRARLEEARTVLAMKAQEQAEHLASGPPEMPLEDANAAIEAATADEQGVNERLVSVRVTLQKDDENRERHAELAAAFAAQEKVHALWKTMADLVGSADGKKLRVFAQSLTMMTLLQEANARLHDIHRRYELQRVPNTDLELQVLDHDMGGEPRAVTSLSGGETFLVSLALALGLSALTARETRIESLFVDEGFGSLDPDTLEQALSALDALQATGCQVGLISHVQGMAERIGTQVRVMPVGSGRSVVRVEGPDHAVVGARAAARGAQA